MKKPKMTSEEAYWYAFDNHTEPGFNLEYYQEIACKYSWEAYWFALRIPGADIAYCQEHACKDPSDAFAFAKNIPGADILYCRKACIGSKYFQYFDKIIMDSVML